MPTAVFLDLDGTLWEWGVVPDSARAAIARAQARGHKVLTNTGRARSEVPDLTPLHLDGYCFSAGAEVIVDGQTVVCEPLGGERARAVAAAFDALGLSYNIEGGDASWIVVNDEAAWERALALTTGADDPIMRMPRADTMPEQAWDDVHKLFYYAAPAGTIELASRLMPAGIRLTDLGLGYAEATDVGVTKATAMEAVRSWLGPDEWRTMALGDSDNDLSMLAAADVSVAMGNGNDNVKATATWTTTAISDNGLWNAFEHFELI